MTLQELHELTGKVLKERPELAEASLVGTDDTNLVQAIIAIYDELGYARIVVKDTTSFNVSVNTEILWQAN